MLKYFAKSGVLGLPLALAFAAAPGAAQAMGPDAAACRAGSGQPAVLVNVNGFKARTGSVRVNVYGSDPARFLGRGQYVRQINVPVSRAGAMPICVAVPNAGRYAVAVRHDADGNGRMSRSTDGGGFSRNPRLTVLNYRPNYENVAFNVGRGVTSVNVTLLYLYGLSIRPVNG
jgi:uncharacterized protein (DUF2141 family)